MNFGWLVLALWLMPTLMSAGEAPTTTPIFVSGEGYARYRIPALSVSKQDTLLAFTEGRVGGGGLTGDIDIVLRRSVDGGKNWLPMQKIADLGADTLGNPCPVVDRDTGTIWLPFTRSPGKLTETQIVAGEGGFTTVWIIHSNDDGKTWSEPRDLSATCRRDDWRWYGTGPGISIQLASGRLLIPSYHSEPNKMYRSHSIYSDDHGQTWKLGETVGEHTAECQAAERRDGTVMLNMRGTNQQFFRTTAISRDGGHSWSTPTLEKQLPEPACEASLLVFSKPGEAPMWLFTNPPGSTRRNLTIRRSLDEGATWPLAKLVDSGPTEYSCLTRLPDGQIGLLYELTRAGQVFKPELHFVRVPWAWLDNDSEPLLTEDDAAFQSLFNGKDLSGWQIMNGGKFSVRDGVIFQNGGSGWLKLEAPHQDFELRLEFRFLKPNSNGGIYFRASAEGATYPSSNYQVQTADNASLSSIYATAVDKPHETRDEARLAKVRKGTGEWQSYHFRVSGDRIDVSVNGSPITSATGLTKRAGHIGLQAEGGEVEYRRLRLRELPTLK